MRPARNLYQGLTPLILLAVVAAFGAWALRNWTVRRADAEREVERAAIAATVAEVGDFDIVVEGVGTLEAVSSKSAVAEVSGQIVSIVPNGVRVKEGEEIAVLDIPRMERQLRDQQLQYDNALADLERRKKDLSTRVRQAEISLQQANDELERFRVHKDIELKDMGAQRDHDAEQLRLAEERFERKRKLAEEGLIPQREIELESAALERDRFNLERQEKDLEIARFRSESETLDKQAAVARAESELARARSAQQDEIRNSTMQVYIQEQQLNRFRDQFGRAVVRAPAAGIVVVAEQREAMAQRPLQPGDQVWEGRPVATIPNLEAMRAVLEVPQEQARIVKRSQPATIWVESLPGLELEGEVTEIAQTASEGGGGRGGLPTAERAFRTFVRIKDTKGAPLRPGMTANVRIIIDRVLAAVAVPLECVFDRDGKHIVYVRRAGEFEPVEVELGQENVDRVVVTKGLKGGEEIALRDISTSANDEAPSDSNPKGSLPIEGVRE